MILPDFTPIELRIDEIVRRIGPEAVEVYCYLVREFESGSVVRNHVFQFVYRSFYRLDNAGLTPEFKSQYFVLLEEARKVNDLDLSALVMRLSTLPTLRGHRSLQFSFVSKLANTVNLDYPVYDSEIASVFSFRAPNSSRSFETRLSDYMAFYDTLRVMYAEILANGTLRRSLNVFREYYGRSADRVPDQKVLDFLFWSAGKLSIVVGMPSTS